MAAQVCKNGVLNVFRAIYSFQFLIKNEFKIIYDHVNTSAEIIYDHVNTSAEVPHPLGEILWL